MSHSKYVEEKVFLATRGSALDPHYHSSCTKITDKKLVNQDRISRGATAVSIALAITLSVMMPGFGFILGLLTFFAVTSWSGYRMSRIPERALDDAIETWAISGSTTTLSGKGLSDLEAKKRQLKGSLSSEDRKNLIMRRPVAVELPSAPTIPERWEDTELYKYHQDRYSRLGKLNILPGYRLDRTIFREAYAERRQSIEKAKQEENVERLEWESERMTNNLTKKSAIIVQGPDTHLISWIEPSATKRWLDSVDNALQL